MRCYIRLQRSLSRLIILAMLAAALLPALGSALAAERAGAPHWIEVCSVGGVEARAASPADSSPSVPSLLVEHCPYCLLSSFDDLLTGPAPSGLPSGDTTAAISPPQSVVVRIAVVWPAAHPRAPPAAV